MHNNYRSRTFEICWALWDTDSLPHWTALKLWRNAAVEGICHEISHAAKHEHPAFLSTSLSLHLPRQIRYSSVALNGLHPREIITRQWASHLCFMFWGEKWIERERVLKLPFKNGRDWQYSTVTQLWAINNLKMHRSGSQKWCFQRDDYILKMMDVCWVMWETGGCPGCSVADDLPLAAKATASCRT